jgi:hypothetical protein
MDAVCTLGCQKLACKALGLSLKTLQSHTSAAGKKMGIDMHIKKYITWHDWMQRRPVRPTGATVSTAAPTFTSPRY